MKSFSVTFFSVLFLYLVFTGCEKEVPEINLNEPYFAIVDTAFFYALISRGVDKNNDGKISHQEAEAVTHLDISGQTPNGRYCTDSTEISDYTGIEAFKNLESLNCLCGDAVNLDLSGNIHLKFLDCSLNKLVNLDVSKCTELTELWCTTNHLANLDVSRNKALKILGCVNNGISNLNVSANTALTQLSCGLNQLSALDLSGLAGLTSLYCVQNNLTELDLSRNRELLYLNFRNNGLTSLDLSQNMALEFLNGNSNYLVALDVSGNPMLTSLYLKNMPSLHGVCVWELPFPPDGVLIDTTGSPHTYFTLECNR